MHSSYRWIVGVLIVSLPFCFACAKSEAPGDTEPARVESLDKTQGLYHIRLSPEAVERLDLRTAPVREAQVQRNRMVGGEVVRAPAGAADSGALLVQVPLSASDAKQVARDQPVRVLPLAGDDKAAGATAKPVEMASGDTGAAASTLHYALDGDGHGLAAGQRVRVELPLSGGGGPKKIIPYAAVIYDLQGATWTYVNASPLVFARQPIQVDYVEGEEAVLSDGPSSGALVVTAGAAALFGTELGIGKQ